MAFAFHFSPSVFTTVQYDECIKRLKKAGAGHPRGRVYHACFGTSDRVAVFDVWTSRAAFEKFGQTLMPILQQLGADPGQPSVTEVHNVIVPTAARRRRAAKTRASARRAQPRKGKTRRRTTKKR
jgi:hypothetical protein